MGSPTFLVLISAFGRSILTIDIQEVTTKWTISCPAPGTKLHQSFSIIHMICFILQCGKHHKIVFCFGPSFGPKNSSHKKQDECSRVINLGQNIEIRVQIWLLCSPLVLYAKFFPILMFLAPISNLWPGILILLYVSRFILQDILHLML